MGIDQACEAIKTLKERLNARQADHERFRQGTIQCAHDTAALEIENERLALKFERQAREAVVLRKHLEEARQLRRDKDVLHEQKEALVLILEDLYMAPEWMILLGANILRWSLRKTEWKDGQTCCHHPAT